MTAKKLLRTILLGGILSIFIIAAAAQSSPQNEQLACADFNGGGSANILDLKQMIFYLFDGASPPVDPLAADCDGHLMFTLHDIQYFADFLLYAGPVPTCPPTDSTPLALDSTVSVTVTGFAPTGSTSTELVVLMTNQSTITGLCLPIQILLDGAPVQIDTASMSYFNYHWDLSGDSVIRIDTANSVVMLAAATWTLVGGPLYTGTHEIGRITVSYSADSVDRDFSYGWKALRPLQHMTGYPDSSLIPMVVGHYVGGTAVKDANSAAGLSQWRPELSSSRYKKGDINGNGMINVTDMIALVGYMFAGGTVPSLEAADVNCNNTVNVSDLIYLVAYFFNGGPAPCL